MTNGRSSVSTNILLNPMSKFIKLSFEDWVAEYKPFRNSFDKNAPVNGLMFETYGSQLDLVNKHDHRFIWTYMETDDGKDIVIVDGKRYVNRVGYFITAVPRKDSTDQFEIAY